MNHCRMLLLLLPLTSCASRQAGMMVAKTQQEFAQYVKDANSKVTQAESARLQLELLDLQDKAIIAHSDPAAVIAHTQQLNANYNARMAEWAKTGTAAASIMTELDSLAGYNNNGVTLDQITQMLTPLQVLIPSATPTPIPMPITGATN